jgi:hypothetical protein
LLCVAIRVLRICQSWNTDDIGYSFLKHRACRFFCDDSLYMTSTAKVFI